MPQEAQPTNFSDPDEVAEKYRQLKRHVSAQKVPQGDQFERIGEMPVHAEQSAPRPVKSQPKPQPNPRRNRSDRRPPAPKPMDVDDYKNLERFKLGVWITKVVILCMSLIIFTVIGIFIYLALSSDSAPDMGLFGSIFGHLKEVLVVVFEANK